MDEKDLGMVGKEGRHSEYGINGEGIGKGNRREMSNRGGMKKRGG